MTDEDQKTKALYDAMAKLSAEAAVSNNVVASAATFLLADAITGMLQLQTRLPTQEAFNEYAEGLVGILQDTITTIIQAVNTDLDSAAPEGGNDTDAIGAENE